MIDKINLPRAGATAFQGLLDDLALLKTDFEPLYQTVQDDILAKLRKDKIIGLKKDPTDNKMKPDFTNYEFTDISKIIDKIEKNLDNYTTLTDARINKFSGLQKHFERKANMLRRDNNDEIRKFKI